MSNQITILFYILFLQLKNDDLTTDFFALFLLILEHFFSSVCVCVCVRNVKSSRLNESVIFASASVSLSLSYTVFFFLP